MGNKYEKYKFVVVDNGIYDVSKIEVRSLPGRLDEFIVRYQGWIEKRRGTTKTKVFSDADFFLNVHETLVEAWIRIDCVLQARIQEAYKRTSSIWNMKVYYGGKNGCGHPRPEVQKVRLMEEFVELVSDEDLEAMYLVLKERYLRMKFDELG